MNWWHRTLIIVAVSIFGAVALAVLEEPLPACNVEIHPDGTWSPVGWDPYFDGIYGCELNTDNRFILKWDGTWEVNRLP